MCYIFVLPISGGGFVSQLAISQHLCEAEIIPEMMVASSGGNVVAYIIAAANCKWAAIERISRQLSQNLFSHPWSGISSLSWIIGWFKGNFNNCGDGVQGFLNDHFDAKSIMKYEIWTGTYNRNRRKARLFCNRGLKNSIIDVSCIDSDLTQSMDTVFTNGNIDLLGKAAIASASIPTMVPAQKIMGEDYIDGGVAGASPLNILEEAILKFIKDKDESLHLIYINSLDLSNPNIPATRTVLDTMKQATDDLVRAQNIIDRTSARGLLRCLPGVLHKDHFVCNYENLKRVKEIQAKIKYSMLEIYPTTRFEINVTNFTGEEVVDMVHRAYKNCRCRLWWLAPMTDVCTSEVCTLINACMNCP